MSTAGIILRAISVLGWRLGYLPTAAAGAYELGIWLALGVSAFLTSFSIVMTAHTIWQHALNGAQRSGVITLGLYQRFAAVGSFADFYDRDVVQHSTGLARRKPPRRRLGRHCTCHRIRGECYRRYDRRRHRPKPALNLDHR